MWQLLKDSLDADVPATLLYVLESSGSSPGRQGFAMAVTADEMQGSIGGGMMEKKLVEKGRANLQSATSHRQTAEIIKQIHNKEAAKNRSGMICSGEQTVMLYRVQQKDSDAVLQIVSCLENFQSAVFELSPQGISFQQNSSIANASFKYKNEHDWLYQERLGYQNHLYIIGGGHCSLALSNLMATLDFYVHVYDDRHHLPTVEQNDAAHETTSLNDYGQLASIIPEGENNYVVIMTVGYRTDDAVIRTLFYKEFRYVGVLGSKAKIEKMFAAYRSEGFDENRLQKLHAPIGIPIKSETPEEIAVSIAAEIIRVKNA